MSMIDDIILWILTTDFLTLDTQWKKIKRSQQKGVRQSWLTKNILNFQIKHDQIETRLVAQITLNTATYTINIPES